ncbi:hypothetical protein EQW78_13645 [Oerskovia turbata]|uniref:DUF559 domain-containing protein n=1 Tax=Oerskovia turbata TaxID=1713 RepID=A0A4Q1KRM3_9CELL|nr:type IV toxin-antitoxin system AbiEi family antitoxin domain-containing protein [Oerskovia turbata]RXR25286.1 hypothetical protein EQW73_10540 [Oerskovia turbata]RXR32773.1 hypothetical protein EQW78_13645 [Oerskovia turbata]TGJ95549.1 hypothetical protein DLJ96_13495 [Actinotalea fermentans ATCC 43279 = JCM 9966 = DSM 3133]
MTSSTHDTGALAALASRQGGVLLTAQLPRPVLRTALSQNLLEKVRRGAYRWRAPDDPAPGHTLDQIRAVAQIEAVSRQLRSPFVLCQESAALVWDLPLWRVPARVHVVQQHRPGTPRPGTDLVRHLTALAPTDTARRRGHVVTSLARTVVDCARTLPALDALVVVDAALRRGVLPERLRDVLDQVGDGRGTARARVLVGLGSRGAESPGESAVRFHLLRRGLPVPTTQIPVTTRLGTFRADLGWPQWRVLVEFDGFVKYSTLAQGDPAKVLFEEKRRQEGIEEEGWRVLRVTARDLKDGAELVQRVLRLLPPGTSVDLERRPHLWFGAV